MRLILDKIKEKVLFLFLFIFSVILYAQGSPNGPGFGGEGGNNGSPNGPGFGGPAGKKTPIDSYEIILIVVALSFMVGYYFYRRRQLSLEK